MKIYAVVGVIENQQKYISNFILCLFYFNVCKGNLIFKGIVAVFSINLNNFNGVLSIITVKCAWYIFLELRRLCKRHFQRIPLCRMRNDNNIRE